MGRTMSEVEGEDRQHETTNRSSRKNLVSQHQFANYVMQDISEISKFSVLKQQFSLLSSQEYERNKWQNL